jgi:hypothetical protein
MSNHRLFLHIKELLRQVYKGANRPDTYLVVTLAWMITGLFFGRHVQLWQIAVWVPLNIQLPSIVRRFERWVANPEVEMRKFFKPFVQAMRNCLGNETAYLIIDCTKAGPKCRTLLIGLAYHGTVLPMVWKTVKGSKGHVTGEFQKALLEQVYDYFCHHKRVMPNSATNRSSDGCVRSSGTLCFAFRAATCCNSMRMENGSPPRNGIRPSTCRQDRFIIGSK